ncbi:CsiV family protein [Thalassolituus oleivorans]|uniref:CsiV family protein n=1 Tax=Thalassolituus oleivorans TaxID=187493 RepID=UPI00240A7140|nr:CsiV family protein [Thalassolituus oleivorans]MDF1640582.1 CsiV family protein [Thalassolituus oleivorans]
MIQFVVNTMRTALPATFMLLCSSMACATPWYRVEVMIVAYLDEANMAQEHWAAAIASDTDSNLATETTTEPLIDPINSMTWWLNPSAVQQRYNALLAGYDFSDVPTAKQLELAAPELNDAIDRINYRSDMTVVWHEVWAEPIQEEGLALPHPLHIELKRDMDIEITGQFSLHRSRYLHFNTDILVQHYHDVAESPLDVLTLPSSDQSGEWLPSGEQSEAQPHSIPLRASTINQTRRMRSGELHYLDHPMLGIVVKVTPIE